MELCLEVIFDFSEVVNERRRMEMEARKRIIFPVDVPTAEEAHKYIILFNGLIGVVKLGFEIIAHAFLTGAQIFKMVLEETDLDVMFDIKGDDIPQTIAGLAKQVALYGQNRIFGFTIHCNAGRKAIQDAVQAVKDNFKGPNPPMVIVVTLLTSLNESDFDDLDIKAQTSREIVLKRARMAAECGAQAIVCSAQETEEVKKVAPGLIVINPGIKFADSKDKGAGGQKRIGTPGGAVANGADYLVIGTALKDGDAKTNAERAIKEIEEGLRIRESALNTDMLVNVKKWLSVKIYQHGGIKFDDVKGFLFNLHKEHPEAPVSPNYVELRRLFRNIMMRKTIAGLMAPWVLEQNPKRLIDLPESTTPLVSTLSDMTGIEMISVRSEALKGGEKDHGTKGVINGYYEEGDTALILDDVVSSFAFTKFKAIPLLREAGFNLLPVVGVVIDREEGGRERLARQGFGLKSLLGLHSDVTKYCIEAGLASEKIREMSIAFAEAAKKFSLAEA